MAQYQYEGWIRMFVALAGTDTQYIIDMLEEMFGEGLTVDPEELLTSDIKAKLAEAHKTEEEVAIKEGELDHKHEVTIIKPTSLPINADFDIDSDLFPKSVPVPGKSVKTGKLVNKFYYKCRICKSHSSQNHPSMCTHTRKCLNIKIGCPFCSATYDSLDYLQNHIMKNHGGSLEPGDQKAAEDCGQTCQLFSVSLSIISTSLDQMYYTPLYFLLKY